jgi:CheY-like chemotaxis protein
MLMLRRRQKERGEIMAAQAEARLQKVQADESRKSVDEKNAFFSNISHDMRTPLNAIIGFTHMAREADITDAQRKEYLEKVESSGALLLELINDTLVISKVNSGKLELDLSPVKLEAVENEIITPIREIAEQKGISVMTDVSRLRSRTVMMDKLNVQKIFLNILNNAVKYTPAGGHIWITLQDVETPEGETDISVSVRDDGIGIDEEFIPHLFEPFSQEKRHGYESVGTGLGLSIVRQLVDLMGGTIDVNSEKDRGTTFTVRLHFEEAEGIDDGGRDEENAQVIGLRGRKVLLCEDNKLNQEIAVALLGDKGIIVDTAWDGTAGVEKFRGSDIGEYDAILMDIRMPNKGGIEAAREIRGMDRADAAAVPIIAMTADAFDEDIRRCMAAGMNAHIAKPIDPHILYETLNAKISGSKHAL